MEPTVEKQKRGQKCSEKQVSMLVELLKTKKHLISGKQTQSYSHKDLVRDWEQITEKLNSIPGAQKSWTGWRKCWQDMKSRTKSKEGGNKREANATGGGPSASQPLTNTEEEILEIMKKVSVEGHNEANESKAVFEFEDVNEFALSTNKILQEVTPLRSNTVCPQVSSTEIKPKSSPTTSIRKDESSGTSTKAKRVPKRKENLYNSAEATAAFKNHLQRKIEIKENYYIKKAYYLEQALLLKERKCKALEEISKRLGDRQ